MEDRANYIAKMMMARVDLQARFAYWNSVAFGGSLPNIPVKLGRSRVWAGICRGTINKYNGTGTVTMIEVSDYIVDDQDVIDKILLHEMIHAYMYLRGRSGHGWEFNALRRQFSTKAGVEIPITEDVSNYQLPDDVEVKEKGVVIIQEPNGKKGLVVYNLNFFMKSLDAIKSYSERIANMYHRNGKSVTYTFLTSKSKDLFKYPEKRSLMQGHYVVSDVLVNDILSSGNKLDEIAA